jgi:hypothetical protein
MRYVDSYRFLDRDGIMNAGKARVYRINASSSSYCRQLEL